MAGIPKSFVTFCDIFYFFHVYFYIDGQMIGHFQRVAVGQSMAGDTITGVS